MVKREEEASGASESAQPPVTGARPVRVPPPEEILRPGYQPAEPDRSLDAEDRGGIEKGRQWRTGRRQSSDENRPDEA